MRFIYSMCMMVGLMPSLAWAACSAPVGQEGQMRYDTGAKNLYVCAGTAWVPLTGTVGYEVVTTHLANIQFEDIRYINVKCPANKKILGGTCMNGAAHNMHTHGRIVWGPWTSQTAHLTTGPTSFAAGEYGLVCSTINKSTTVIADMTAMAICAY